MLELTDLFIARVLYGDGCAPFPCNFEVAVVASEVSSASCSASRENVAVVSFPVSVCFRAWARELDAWYFSRCVGLACAGGTSAVLSSMVPIFGLVGGVAISGSLIIAAFLPLMARDVVFVFV